MSDKAQPFLTLDLRCGCGASLFVEIPQEPTRAFGMDELPKQSVTLATCWTQAHAAHHQEPKRG